MEMLLHGNALLALAAAVLWGGGDFSGGMSVKTAGGTMGAALRVIVLSPYGKPGGPCWWRRGGGGETRFRMEGAARVGTGWPERRQGLRWLVSTWRCRGGRWGLQRR